MYAKVVSSGAIIPARAPPSIDMLQIVMRPSIERARIVDPRYSITWPVAPPVPMWAMTPRMMSLAVTPVGSSPSTVDCHRLGLILGKGLGGENVLDLGGADAEGERAERSVGRGVRVAADNQHPRLGDALLGPDDVDDARARIIETEKVDAELFAVSNQGVDLDLRHRVGDAQMAVGGWDAVIDRGEGEIGPTHRPAVHPQRVECLWRGDLMNEVQIDVKQIGFARALTNQVTIPNLLEQSADRSQVEGYRGGRLSFLLERSAEVLGGGLVISDEQNSIEHRVGVGPTPDGFDYYPTSRRARIAEDPSRDRRERNRGNPEIGASGEGSTNRLRQKTRVVLIRPVPGPNDMDHITCSERARTSDGRLPRIHRPVLLDPTIRLVLDRVTTGPHDRRGYAPSMG